LKDNKKKPFLTETGDNEGEPEIIKSAKIAQKVFGLNESDEKTEDE